MTPIKAYFTDQDNNTATGYLLALPREGEIVYLVLEKNAMTYSKYIVENVCHWVTRAEALTQDYKNCHMIIVYVKKEGSDDEPD